MAARGGEKEPLDAVSQNRILCERVRKELHCQKLHTRFDVNPLHRVHTLTRKPMSWHDNVEETADGFRGSAHRTERYSCQKIICDMEKNDQE
ncbi:protein FAM183A isoform X2 [Apus apus]|uniref:protein FAM183A isoform X2 n=1 Tax=Apus apus TaxID=8895 RepID=UPI0021F822C2|nr:protein FAM183A isoform X2 [Apus apus]